MQTRGAATAGIIWTLIPHPLIRSLKRRSGRRHEPQSLEQPRDILALYRSAQLFGRCAYFFIKGAQIYWPAILITHLKNGIHGVQQKWGPLGWRPSATATWDNPLFYPAPPTAFPLLPSGSSTLPIMPSIIPASTQFPFPHHAEALVLIRQLK